MHIVELNLCDLLLDEMKKLEFNTICINYVKRSQIFIDAFHKESVMQRSLLSVLLYKIMMYSNINVPKEIRLALNMSNDSVGWLNDIKLVILPYLRENEEVFFPIP